MRRHLTPILSAVLTFILWSPRATLAQWPHWYQFGTEGSYVHEMAHLAFAVGMLFFIHQIFHAKLQHLRGFKLLAWAWGILALWNLDAIVGHWADWTLSNPIILGQGFGRRLLMYDFHTWLVYITKIDHFLFLAPAFYLLYRGLRILEQDAEAEER